MAFYDGKVIIGEGSRLAGNKPTIKRGTFTKYPKNILEKALEKLKSMGKSK